MAERFESKLVDKRVVYRYVRKGLVDERELRDLMKELPDLAEQAVPVEASIAHATDLGDEDETEGGTT